MDEFMLERMLQVNEVNERTQPDNIISTRAKYRIITSPCANAKP